MKKNSKLILLMGLSTVAITYQSVYAQESLTLFTYGDSITAGLIETIDDGASAECPPGVSLEESLSGSGDLRCFGNGAEGVGGYQPELKDSFEEFGYDVSIYNYGYSGITTSQMNSWINGDLDERPSSDYVLLMGGANDAFISVSASSVEFNMQTMVNKVCNKGMLPVLATATKYLIDTAPGGVNSFIQSYNVEFRQITTATSNCSVINVEQYDALKVSSSNYDFDGLHLSSAGNTLMASVWFQTMDLEDLTFVPEPEPEPEPDFSYLPPIIELLLDE